MRASRSSMLCAASSTASSDSISAPGTSSSSVASLSSLIALGNGSPVHVSSRISSRMNVALAKNRGASIRTMVRPGRRSGQGLGTPLPQKLRFNQPQTEFATPVHSQSGDLERAGHCQTLSSPFNDLFCVQIFQVSKKFFQGILSIFRSNHIHCNYG